MKTTPYTMTELKRAKCVRCGEPAEAQWSVCADHNHYRPLCLACDVELNELVLRFLLGPAAKDKIKEYKQSKQGLINLRAGKVTADDAHS